MPDLTDDMNACLCFTCMCSHSCPGPASVPYAAVLKMAKESLAVIRWMQPSGMCWRVRACSSQLPWAGHHEHSLLSHVLHRPPQPLPAQPTVLDSPIRLPHHQTSVRPRCQYTSGSKDLQAQKQLRLETSRDTGRTADKAAEDKCATLTHHSERTQFGHNH